jgi:prevent-host-death family protein
MALPEFAETLSVTDASSRGLAGLVRDAEHGHDVVVARRGAPVAAVIGMHRLAELRELERDLRSAALVLARAATDAGERVSLDDAIAAFGFDRAELEAELAAESADEAT